MIKTGGPTATDSARTNSATLTNTSWGVGKTGNAASFNGTNASGDPGKIDFGTRNFTVAHWIKVSGFKKYAASLITVTVHPQGSVSRRAPTTQVTVRLGLNHYS